MAEYAEMSIARQSRWVDALWTLSASGSTRRILPDGCIDFIFDLSSGRARVVGSMTTSQVIDTSAGARCFGVRFAPGAAAAFLGEPASALTDTDADLDELTRARELCLAERIAEASTDARRAVLITEFLESSRSRLRPLDPRVRRATQQLRNSRGALPIAELAHDLGLSERQLERLFHEHVGTRPKLFARVVRMQTALRWLESSTAYRASGGVAAGFADEPHLVRDFRALTGITPQQLVRERRVGFVQAESNGSA
jgi:AraC-like DNA-binding protein